MMIFQNIAKAFAFLFVCIFVVVFTPLHNIYTGVMANIKISRDKFEHNVTFADIELAVLTLVPRHLTEKDQNDPFVRNSEFVEELKLSRTSGHRSIRIYRTNPTKCSECQGPQPKFIVSPIGLSGNEETKFYIYDVFYGKDAIEQAKKWLDDRGAVGNIIQVPWQCKGISNESGFEPHLMYFNRYRGQTYVVWQGEVSSISKCKDFYGAEFYFFLKKLRQID